MDLFDSVGRSATGVPEFRASAPLAVRMRPVSLDEVVGQSHLLEPGSPLRRLVDDGAGASTSVMLWGPPGTGKTTLAYLVAGGRRFEEISAVAAGVKEVRAVIEDSKRRLASGGRETVVFIDEVHRFSKSQQDVLLPAVENRWITLIAATTENPSFSVIGPLLSRSLLLTLQPLAAADVGALIDRAVADERGLGGSITLAADAREHIVRVAGADARKALTVLESLAAAAGEGGTVTRELAEQAMDAALVAYDRQGDQHYDVISAYIKSVRGSDVDAALHYLARMVVAGEDARFIARRLVILAAEDVGLADPQALVVAQAAADAVSFIGMPEGRIVLGEATAYLAMAPKSNRAYLAIDRAIADVRAGRAGEVPIHLRDGHYAGSERLGHGKGYVYAHDAERGVAAQAYLPAALDGAVYYEPTDHGFEKTLGERRDVIRRLLGRRDT